MLPFFRVPPCTVRLCWDFRIDAKSLELCARGWLPGTSPDSNKIPLLIQFHCLLVIFFSISSRPSDVLVAAGHTPSFQLRSPSRFHQLRDHIDVLKGILWPTDLHGKCVATPKCPNVDDWLSLPNTQSLEASDISTSLLSQQ